MEKKRKRVRRLPAIIGRQNLSSLDIAILRSGPTLYGTENSRFLQHSHAERRFHVILNAVKDLACTWKRFAN